MKSRSLSSTLSYEISSLDPSHASAASAASAAAAPAAASAASAASAPAAASAASAASAAFAAAPTSAASAAAPRSAASAASAPAAASAASAAFAAAPRSAASAASAAAASAASNRSASATNPSLDTDDSPLLFEPPRFLPAKTSALPVPSASNVSSPSASASSATLLWAQADPLPALPTAPTPTYTPNAAPVISDLPELPMPSASPLLLQDPPFLSADLQTTLADPLPLFSSPLASSASSESSASSASSASLPPAQGSGRHAPSSASLSVTRAKARRYQDGLFTTSSSDRKDSIKDAEGAVFELPYRSTDVLMRIGGYDLLKVLGEGGMGLVYKAYSLSLCRFCAIKIMKPNDDLTEASILRFQNEAVLAARLRHPNIIHVFDFGEKDGAFYFVMEYIRGGSLLDLIQDGSPEAVKRGLYALAKVARALDYAHKRGIVHRDIKPENILIDDQGEPYLTDFGIAKDRGQDLHLTAAKAALGTPFYMSPEQANGEAQSIGPHSDIFSLGATLYHLITKRVPFFGDSFLQVLLKVLTEEAEPPHLVAKRLRKVDLPLDLETICLKALEKEASRRYPTALAFADDLDAFLADRPISARPLSSQERFQKLLQRNRAAFVGASVVLSVLLLMTLAFGSLLLFNIQRTSNSLRLQDRKAAEDQAKTLIRAIAASMLEGRADIVRSLVQKLRTDTQIASIDVVRTDRTYAYTDLSTRRFVEQRLRSFAPLLSALDRKNAASSSIPPALSPAEFRSLRSPHDPPSDGDFDLINWIGANFSEVKGRLAQVQTIAFSKIESQAKTLPPPAQTSLTFSGRLDVWNQTLLSKQTQIYLDSPSNGPPLLTLLMPIKNERPCHVCHGDLSLSNLKVDGYSQPNDLRGVLVVRRSQKDLEERIRANQIATAAVGGGTTLALFFFLFLFTRLFDIGLRPRRFGLPSSHSIGQASVLRF